MPRTFDVSFHGTEPNDLPLFDYIKLGPTSIGSKNVLTVRDDHLGYCWLFAFPGTVAETATKANIDWSVAFGVPRALRSDAPTHFRNESVRLVSKGLRVPHHLTLLYFLW